MPYAFSHKSLASVRTDLDISSNFKFPIGVPISPWTPISLHPGLSSDGKSKLFLQGRQLNRKVLSRESIRLSAAAETQEAEKATSSQSPEKKEDEFYEVDFSTMMQSAQFGQMCHKFSLLGQKTSNGLPTALEPETAFTVLDVVLYMSKSHYSKY